VDGNLIREAVVEAGGPGIVASEFGLSVQAVYKWMNKGLPRSDWTGETDYASVIARLAKDKRFSRDRLLEYSKSHRKRRNGKAEARL
jgi:hypothetical protein